MSIGEFSDATKCQHQVLQFTVPTATGILSFKCLQLMFLIALLFLLLRAEAHFTCHHKPSNIVSFKKGFESSVQSSPAKLNITFYNTGNLPADVVRRELLVNVTSYFRQHVLVTKPPSLVHLSRDCPGEVHDGTRGQLSFCSER